MKKVIIVGGGVAGLSAGVHALQNGFDTTIYEMHTIPGGNSTSWKREGYLFEGGIHWMTGTKKDTPLYKLWCNVGALSDTIRIYNRDPFLTYVHDDHSVCLYRNPDKLRNHLISISPEDKIEIDIMYEDIKSFTGLSQDNLKISEHSKLSVMEYSNKFSHPAIRALLQNMVDTNSEALFLLFALSCLASGDGGYPEGGSLAMALRMAEHFEGLGGKIKYSTRVNKVLVKDGDVKGILVNNEEIYADAVVVCSDTLSAIDNLFKKPLTEPWMEAMRINTKPVLNTFIGLGVRADLSGLPGNMLVPLAEPLIYAGEEINTLNVYNYATYKGYAPKDCTALTILLMGDTYDYWKTLKKKGIYKEEKEKLPTTIIKHLENQFPQISGKIVVQDIATPITYERYCGTYKGSWMTIKTKDDDGAAYPAVSENIKNLYFAG